MCSSDLGSSGEFYIDGSMKGGYTNSGAMDSGRPLYVGANMDGANGSGSGIWRPTGYISNLRWVVGHKTYDSNFTPPTQPLTATSQSVPASACKLVAFNSDSDWQTTYQTSASFSMTTQSGTPSANSTNPFTNAGQWCCFQDRRAILDVGDSLLQFVGFFPQFVIFFRSVPLNFLAKLKCHLPQFLMQSEEVKFLAI